MKTFDQGYGNSGDMIGVRERAWKQKSYRYVIITTSGGHSGAIGGSFNYKVFGTNNMRELLKPSVMRDSGQIIDTEVGKEIERSQLAKEYVSSLTDEQRTALINEMLQKFLTEDDQ